MEKYELHSKKVLPVNMEFFVYLRKYKVRDIPRPKCSVHAVYPCSVAEVYVVH